MPAKYASLNEYSYSKMSDHPSYTNLQYLHILKNVQNYVRY